MNIKKRQLYRESSTCLSSRNRGETENVGKFEKRVERVPKWGGDSETYETCRNLVFIVTDRLLASPHTPAQKYGAAKSWVCFFELYPLEQLPCLVPKPTFATRSLKTPMHVPPSAHGICLRKAHPHQ